MSDIFIDTAFSSLTKYNEELCGDHVEISRSKDGAVIVLSDGLGSGVKANILSTITAKIISTMVLGGATLEDTVETVVNTLPVCKVRKVAYSTFSVLTVSQQGKASLTEFDSPSCIFIRDGKVMDIAYNEKEICGHNIHLAEFDVKADDMLMLVTDGVIYSGLGKKYPLGWGIDNVRSFIADIYKNDAHSAAELLCRKCSKLYDNKPGDDTTAAAVKIQNIKKISLFSGPPVDPKDDEKIVADFLSVEGKKVICGGSSATIAARVMNKELIPTIEYVDPQIPPIAVMEGIDLVTEGVLTLKRTVDLIKKYHSTGSVPKGKSAADLLALMLIRDCTELDMFIGMQKNPAHSAAELSSDLGWRLIILNDLYKLMQQLGRIVKRKYY